MGPWASGYGPPALKRQQNNRKSREGENSFITWVMCLCFHSFSQNNNSIKNKNNHQPSAAPVTKTSSDSPLMVRWMRPLFSVWSWPHRLGTRVSQRRWTFMSQPGRRKTARNVSTTSASFMHRSDGQTDSLEHFMPWWMRPYSSEPQWSQKVGLEYVCTLNMC